MSKTRISRKSCVKTPARLMNRGWRRCRNLKFDIFKLISRIYIYTYIYEYIYWASRVYEKYTSNTEKRTTPRLFWITKGLILQKYEISELYFEISIILILARDNTCIYCGQLSMGKATKNMLKFLSLNFKNFLPVNVLKWLFGCLVHAALSGQYISKRYTYSHSYS